MREKLEEEGITIPDTGVHPETSMKEYHSWDCASSSQLQKLSKSPAHLRAYLEEEYEETEALKLGRLIHKAVLEPRKFEENYTTLGVCEATKGSGEPCTNSAKYVTPDGDFCGVHGDAESHDQSIKIVKDDQMRTIQGIKKSISETDTTQAMISGAGETEYSYVFDDPKTGVRCRARMDRYSPDVPGGAIVDLKTTRDARPSKFQKQIFNRGYYLQGALYLRGAQALDLDLEHFVIVAVEKKPPYGVRVYKLSDELISAEVDRQLTDLLELYRSCKEHDRWPGYPDEIETISIPSWAESKIEERTDKIPDLLRRVEQGG